MEGDGGVAVIADRVCNRDLAKDFFALDDMQTDSFASYRENTQDHVVLGNDNS